MKHKALYNILGLNREGKKEVLGMYIPEIDRPNFWLLVLTHLQQSRLLDILIACTDNLKGITEAIHLYFQKQISSCVSSTGSETASSTFHAKIPRSS